jgi:hypothetical protein
MTRRIPHGGHPSAFSVVVNLIGTRVLYPAIKTLKNLLLHLIKSASYKDRIPHTATMIAQSSMALLLAPTDAGCASSPAPSSAVLAVSNRNSLIGRQRRSTQ